MSKTDAHYAHMANVPYETPCARCGATQRDAKGHDPCIPDLPGVLHACCGHGTQPGYVAFENGFFIRGEFDFNEEIRRVFLEYNEEFLNPGKE